MRELGLAGELLLIQFEVVCKHRGYRAITGRLSQLPFMFCTLIGLVRSSFEQTD